MGLSKQTKFILAIVLQLIVIFAIIIFKLSILTSGTEVLLRIKPVDPRDFLRGDYATFRYIDVSEIPMYIESQSIRRGDTVYVMLIKEGEYWTGNRLSTTKPSSSKSVFLKGKAMNDSSRISSSYDACSGRGDCAHDSIRVVYGIEEYFIPEGKGRISSWDRAFAKVAVDENGNAVIKQLYVDNKPWPN